MENSLARLPLNYRSVIHLFYFEDMSITQIAKTLQANENTIKTWLSRARKLLKVDLERGVDDV
jgi:RNA polymerase sigma-70 factor (ECF subfamily)